MGRSRTRGRRALGAPEATAAHRPLCRRRSRQRQPRYPDIAANVSAGRPTAQALIARRAYLPRAQLVEPPVHERDRRRAVTGRAATRLAEPWRTSPAANRPGHARLERERVARERPALGPLARDEQVGAGEDVAGAVEPHAHRVGPAGARRAAEAEEQRARRQRLALAVRAARRSPPTARRPRRRPRRPRCAAARRSADAPRCARRGRRTSTCRGRRRARASSRARAASARFITAWPAELPAPTTTTSSPPHCAASLRPAP